MPIPSNSQISISSDNIVRASIIRPLINVLTLTGYKPVTKIISVDVMPLIRINFEDRPTFECTPHQEIAVCPNILFHYFIKFQWKKAKDLVPGDKVVSPLNNVFYTVTSLEPGRNEDSYDFQVEGDNSYFCENVLLKGGN